MLTDDDGGVNPLGDLVRAERLRRGESVRAAATRGGISNTWWARFEDGTQPLTPRITKAVAKAFKWPAGWPETVSPPAADPDVAELRKLVAAQEKRLTALARQFAHLQQQIEAGARASRAAHQEQVAASQSIGESH